jgi:transposase
VKYYAGLDVAMKETFVCIVDENGKRVYEGKSFSDPLPIFEALIKLGLKLEKVGLEAGSISSYLTKGLMDLGINAICIDARKMAAILSVTVNKTDKNDARGIADAIRCNHYKEVNLRDIEDASLNVLLKSRGALVQTRTTYKNTIRGHLKCDGKRLGMVSNKNFTEAVQNAYTEMLYQAKIGIDGLLKVFNIINSEIDQLDKQLTEICKQNEIVKLLMTAPGVGPIVALTYVAGIGDPSRFEDSESVGAYLGMAPRQYSSGETVKQGGVSKCGSKDLRYLLVEAAIVMLTRFKGWCPLKAWGLKLMKKSGLKKAAVAVARKLSVIMHKMMTTGETFRFSNSAIASAA